MRHEPTGYKRDRGETRPSSPKAAHEGFDVKKTPRPDILHPGDRTPYDGNWLWMQQDLVRQDPTQDANPQSFQ